MDDGRGSRKRQSQVETPEALEPLCVECGAPISEFSPRCWLCQASATHVRGNAQVVADHLARPDLPPGPPRQPPGYAWVTELLIFAMLLAIAYGCRETAPGIMWLILLFVVPTWVISSVRIKFRTARHGPFSLGDKFLTVVTSFAVLCMVAIGLVMAAFAFLFVLCLQAISKN